jgi:hypothetical protein
MKSKVNFSKISNTSLIENGDFLDLLQLSIIPNEKYMF